MLRKLFLFRDTPTGPVFCVIPRKSSALILSHYVQPTCYCGLRLWVEHTQQGGYRSISAHPSAGLLAAPPGLRFGTFHPLLGVICRYRKYLWGGAAV